jgi:hypothetical protein
MTNFTQLVQASADIITVINLKKGDVYKRLHQEYSTSPYKLVIGIVTDVMLTEGTAGIAAFEITQGENYTEATTPKFVVYGPKSDVQIFPAEPLEVEAVLGKAADVIEKKLAEAEEAVVKADALRYNFYELMTYIQTEGLTVPEHTVTSAVLPEIED